MGYFIQKLTKTANKDWGDFNRNFPALCLKVLLSKSDFPYL